MGYSLFSNEHVIRSWSLITPPTRIRCIDKKEGTFLHSFSFTLNYSKMFSFILFDQVWINQNCLGMWVAEASIYERVTVVLVVTEHLLALQQLFCQVKAFHASFHLIHSRFHLSSPGRSVKSLEEHVGFGKSWCAYNEDDDKPYPFFE